MIRKNLHEFLYSQQHPDNIYTAYNEHKSAMKENIIKSQAEVEIKELSEKALKEVIEDILNPKKH